MLKKFLVHLFLFCWVFPGVSWGLECEEKHYCYQMATCEEAFWFYKNCGLKSLDRDQDGIPCEELCGDVFPELPNSTVTCKIERVIDGDTVSFGEVQGFGELLGRLIVIDAPEEKRSLKLSRDAQRCGVSEDEIIPLGRASSSVLEDLIKGKDLLCQAYGFDRYRRVLVDVKADQDSLSKLLLAGGYACIWRNIRLEVPVSLLQEHYDALWQAALEKRGLWEEYPDLMSCLCGLVAKKLPIPRTGHWVVYQMSSIPETDGTLAGTKPLSVMEHEGTVGLLLGVPAFESQVKVYLGVRIPWGEIYALTREGKTVDLDKLSPVLTTEGPASLAFGPYQGLLPGYYTFYILVTPVDVEEPLKSRRYVLYETTVKLL